MKTTKTWLMGRKRMRLVAARQLPKGPTANEGVTALEPTALLAERVQNISI